MSAWRDNRRSLGHLLLSLHIRDTTGRPCHTHRYRRWGKAVSVVCGLVWWVLVSLHRAGRCLLLLLLRERVADAGGADGRCRRLPVGRRPRSGLDARRPEVIGRHLLERWWRRRRRGTVRVRSGRSLVRCRRCVRARWCLLHGIIERELPAGRWLGLAVFAKGLVRVRLHRRRRHRWLQHRRMLLLDRRLRRLARSRRGRPAVVQHPSQIHNGGARWLEPTSIVLLVFASPLDLAPSSDASARQSRFRRPLELFVSFLSFSVALVRPPQVIESPPSQSSGGLLDGRGRKSDRCRRGNVVVVMGSWFSLSWQTASHRHAAAHSISNREKGGGSRV